MIEDAFFKKLGKAKSLPSPPSVAIRLLELSEDPDVSIKDLIAVVETDPALAAKLLRIASSPMYVRRRHPETIHEAAMTLGLNTVFTVALSFSLVPDRDGAVPPVLATQVWQRSVLSAAAARVLAARIPQTRVEDAALVALLQEIGVLAIHRVNPAVYDQLDPAATHADLIAAEVEALGGDHAEVGAHVLTQWKLPDEIVHAVAESHRAVVGAMPDTFLGRVSAATSRLSDAIADSAIHLDEARRFILDAFEIDASAFPDILRELSELGPTLADLFETKPYDMTDVLEEAQEQLLVRQAMRDDEQSRLREVTEQLEERTAALEAETERDVLTGLNNRRALERRLDAIWASATQHDMDVAVVFVDLDNFKSVNDTHGHAAGDHVITETGRRLSATAPDDAMVVRYGGEEFVVVLPATDQAAAEAVAAQIVDVTAATPFEIGPGGPITVTTSAGVTVRRPDDDPEALLARADRALYDAKRGGRNQWCAG